MAHPRALEDPALFADIDALLRAAIERSQPAALLLTGAPGDPSTWRLDTAINIEIASRHRRQRRSSS